MSPDALQIISRPLNGAERELLQDQAGEVWMTSEQIGLALGYSEPAKAIAKLYERHIDDLRDFRSDVKLTKEHGAKRLTTIWRREALYMFAMLARTEAASEFRRWLTQTCRELEDGDKVLVSRADLEAHMRYVARYTESTAGMLSSLASIHGSALAKLGALKKRHPEMFGHVGCAQRFFEFADAEELEADRLDENGGDL